MATTTPEATDGRPTTPATTPHAAHPRSTPNALSARSEEAHRGTAKQRGGAEVHPSCCLVVACWLLPAGCCLMLMRAAAEAPRVRACQRHALNQSTTRHHVIMCIITPSRASSPSLTSAMRGVRGHARDAASEVASSHTARMHTRMHAPRRALRGTAPPCLVSSLQCNSRSWKERRRRRRWRRRWPRRWRNRWPKPQAACTLLACRSRSSLEWSRESRMMMAAAAGRTHAASAELRDISLSLTD